MNDSADMSIATIEDTLNSQYAACRRPWESKLGQIINVHEASNEGSNTNDALIVSQETGEYSDTENDQDQSVRHEVSDTGLQVQEENTQDENRIHSPDIDFNSDTCNNESDNESALEIEPDEITVQSEATDRPKNTPDTANNGWFSANQQQHHGSVISNNCIFNHAYVETEQLDDLPASTIGNTNPNNLVSPIDQSTQTPETLSSEENSNENIEPLVSAIENIELSDDSHLKVFLSSLHLIGMSFIPSEKKNVFCGKTIQKMVFLSFVLIGILHAVLLAKLSIFKNLYGVEILLFCVEFVYIMNVILLRLFYPCLIYFKSNNIVRMFETLKKWKTLSNSSTIIERKNFELTTFCLLSSIVLALCVTCLEFARYWGAEPKEMILYASRDLSYALYAWDFKNIKNMTSYFTKKYGTEITLETFTLGVINHFISFLGLFQQNIIKDISIVSAVTLYSMTNDFTKLLKANDGQVRENNQLIWKQFKVLSEFSSNLDGCFGMLFQLITFDNVFSSAYCLFNQVVRDEDEMYTYATTIISILYFLKYLSFYIISAMASSVNSTFKSWILRNFHGYQTTFIEQSQPVATLTLCEKISADPIGIGRGIFLIDVTFIWKFSSVVGSLFVFFHNPRIEPSLPQDIV